MNANPTLYLFARYSIRGPFTKEPILSTLAVIPKAITNSLPLNQVEVVVWETTRIFSPPSPKMNRPIIIRVKLALKPPIAKMNYPVANSDANSGVPILIPSLSIKIPPKIGNIMLGKE